MTSRRIAAVSVFAICASVAGAAFVQARGQATTRPGEPTLARVWVENRAPNDAIPVLVESIATPVTTHLDSTSTVQTIAGRQMWQYRTSPLPKDAAGESLNQFGMEGWEAVGVLPGANGGSTILFKRPR